LIVLAPTLASAKTYNEGTGDTWDCAKDGSVSINANDGTYTFKGPCKAIAVNGNNNKVSAEGSTAVSVNGNKNTVDVVAADAIAVNGNDNKVTYTKGLSKAKPSVSNPGNRNTVAVGKAADKPADTAKAKDKPAESGTTTVDCAKSPSYSIPNGEGTYTFTGTCDKISVAGGENTLSIEAVKELAVAGAENTIAVTAAEKISVVGADNKITYKKGISGAKPVVKIVGTGNKVQQVK
jgi:hypothetical protein